MREGPGKNNKTLDYNQELSGCQCRLKTTDRVRFRRQIWAKAELFSAWTEGIAWYTIVCLNQSTAVIPNRGGTNNGC